MVSFLEAFSSKRFVCCTLTEVYSTYNTVGRRPQRYIYLGLYISAIDLPTILYVLHIHLQLRSSKMTPLQKWPVLTLTPQPIHCTPHCFQVHKSSEGDAAMRVQDMLSLSHEADLVGQWKEQLSSTACTWWGHLPTAGDALSAQARITLHERCALLKGRISAL